MSQRTECDQHKARLRINGVLRDVATLEATAQAARESKGAEAWILPARLIHACMGITKEGGELLSVLEKWLYFGKAYTPEELKQKVKDEGGDVLWYLAELFNAVGLDMGEVMAANVSKLQARYPEKFTDHHAADENRNREAEAEALGVIPGSTICRQELINAGQPYPKSCPTCGLFGQCKKGLPPSADWQQPAVKDEIYTARSTPPQLRTLEQVRLLQGTVYGCCNRHADNQGCDCMSVAVTNARKQRAKELGVDFIE